MILILADTTDPWAMLLRRELQRSGAAVAWIRPTQLLDKVQVNRPVLSDTSVLSGSVIVDRVTIPLADLTGVFLRLTLPIDFEDSAPADRDYGSKETAVAWLELLNALPCPVVNRPLPGGRPTIFTGSPVSARLAGEHGLFLTPVRCITSRTDGMLQFSAWNHRVYLKPLDSHEPGMFLQPQDGAEDIGRFLDRQAASMQQVPHGQRMTVYVAGDNVVATVVQTGDLSDAIGTILPSIPTEACLGLVRALGLSFAECQLVVTPDKTYCLDVSRAPCYWRCPQEVQHLIVCRLAGFLSEPGGVPLDDSLDGAGARKYLCETRRPER